jgi:hypothetical protein
VSSHHLGQHVQVGVLEASIGFLREGMAMSLLSIQNAAMIELTAAMQRLRFAS